MIFPKIKLDITSFIGSIISLTFSNIANLIPTATNEIIIVNIIFQMVLSLNIDTKNWYEKYITNILLNIKSIYTSLYFINTNKNDKKLQNLLTNPQTKTFDSIRTVLYDKIPREELSKYLKFEFLHDHKLKEHYPDIFEQIFNERDLLKNINLSRTEVVGGVKTVENFSAEVFILKYRDIRNSIAHENYKFSVENEQFKEYVEFFQKIIKCMIDKFETVTGFPVDSKSNNILNSI